MLTFDIARGSEVQDYQVDEVTLDVAWVLIVQPLDWQADEVLFVLCISNSLT